MMPTDRAAADVKPSKARMVCEDGRVFKVVSCLADDCIIRQTMGLKTSGLLQAGSV